MDMRLSLEQRCTFHGSPAHAGIDRELNGIPRGVTHESTGSPAHAGIDPLQVYRPVQTNRRGSPAHAGIDRPEGIRL